MVCIQGGLDTLFPRLDFLCDLTPFGEEEKGKHIYHPYLDTRPNLAPLYYHAHLRIGVLMPLVPLHHSHYC